VGDVFGRNQSRKNISRQVGRLIMTIEPDDGENADYEFEEARLPGDAIRTQFGLESWTTGFLVTRPAGKNFKLTLSAAAPDKKQFVVLCQRDGKWEVVYSGSSINGLKLPVGDPAIGIR
jgi:hypothetical protein